ncbi:MAG: DUF11 domain-containing protein, partial [Nitrospinae bacterium]|nr:DUF11 domain-containing protein [Nitrospinota bacterium]
MDEATTITRLADLTVTKDDDVDPVVAGAQLTYTVTITNNGPSDATGVTVADAVPTGLSVIIATATQGSFDTVTNTWTVGGLPLGGIQTLTLITAVASSAPSALSNLAEVAASETDPEPV